MVIVVVATTEDELAAVRGSLGERGVGAVQVVAPSDTRRLVLAAVDDEWEAHRLASTLRAEGRSAVTRPDGGARLEAVDAPHPPDHVRGAAQRVLCVVRARPRETCRG